MPDPVLAHVRRRQTLGLVAGVTLMPATAWSQKAEARYLLATLSEQKFPFSKVGTCKDLEKTIALFESEAKRAGSKPKEAGAEYLNRARAQRKALKEAIGQAEQNQAMANIDKLFVGINLGVQSTLMGLGCLLTGPYVVGALLGASLVSGATVFVAQAMFKQGDSEPVSVWGYVGDRAITLTSIAKGGPAPPAGLTMVGAASSAVALFVAAYQFGKAESRAADALTALKLATARLKEVDAAIGQMGTDAAAWGLLYSQVMASSRDGLRRYVDDMRPSNCMFTPPDAGPTLRKY